MKQYFGFLLLLFNTVLHSVCLIHCLRHFISLEFCYLSIHQIQIQILSFAHLFKFISFRFVFVVIRAATRTTTTDTTNTDVEQYVVPACRASAKRLKARAGNEWTMEFRFPNIHAGQNGRAKKREIERR